LLAQNTRHFALPLMLVVRRHLSESRITRAVMLLSLSAIAASTTRMGQASLTPCAELEGRTVGLRGKVSQARDNAPPDFSSDAPIIIDAWERVVVLTLRRPICSADHSSKSDRPVVQPEVTIVELVPKGSVTQEDLQVLVGRVAKLEGVLSENVWWHYRATLRMAVTKVD
jgi:hypothetical protein